LFHKFLELLIELVFNGTDVFPNGLYLFISHQALKFAHKVFHGHFVIVQKRDMVPLLIVGILCVLCIGFVYFIHGIIGLGGIRIFFGRCRFTLDRSPVWESPFWGCSISFLGSPESSGSALSPSFPPSLGVPLSELGRSPC